MTAALTTAPAQSLAEGQWQIEDLVFGKDTRFPIATFPDIAYGDITSQDAPIPRGDGLVMGRDSRGGNIITFDMAVWSPRLETDLAWLAKWWRGHPVRHQPGKAIPLWFCFEGRQRMVFGRPRNFAPAVGTTRREWIPLTCDFQCVDDKFYSAELFHQHVGLRPPSLGGFSAPLSEPIRAHDASAATTTEFAVGGVAEAWATLVLHGPIAAPQAELYRTWTQTMPRVSLNYDQTLTARSAPWQRGITDENGRGIGGIFDAASRKLSALTLPPGQHELVLRGQDPTGSAAVDLYWHETFLAP